MLGTEENTNNCILIRCPVSFAFEHRKQMLITPVEQNILEFLLIVSSKNFTTRLFQIKPQTFCQKFARAEKSNIQTEKRCDHRNTIAKPEAQLSPFTLKCCPRDICINQSILNMREVHRSLLHQTQSGISCKVPVGAGKEG